MDHVGGVGSPGVGAVGCQRVRGDARPVGRGGPVAGGTEPHLDPRDLRHRRPGWGPGIPSTRRRPGEAAPVPAVWPTPGDRPRGGHLPAMSCGCPGGGAGGRGGVGCAGAAACGVPSAEAPRPCVWSVRSGVGAQVVDCGGDVPSVPVTRRRPCSRCGRSLVVGDRCFCVGGRKATCADCGRTVAGGESRCPVCLARWEAARAVRQPYRAAYSDSDYRRNRLGRYRLARGCCEMCGRPLVKGQWDCHHVIELEQGGSNAVENLRVLCRRPCHERLTAQARRG